jgi:hypothetical protein
LKVAEGGGLNESLPMLLRVPYFGLPAEFGAYSMLGFGDIILPGSNILNSSNIILTW